MADQRRLSPLLPALGLLVAGAGCLSANRDAMPIMCETTSDCDAGESCDEGICYGDPPTHLSFAAIIEPPADSEQPLVTTEIPSLRVEPDGTIVNLEFADVVTIQGQVTLSCDSDLGLPCSTAPVPTEATIVLERPSRIPGHPPLKITTVATPSDDSDDASFQLHLPKSQCLNGLADCEDAYQAVVLPKSVRSLTEGTANEDAAALAAPLRFFVAARENSELLWTLGAPEDLKKLTGCVSDGENAAMPGLTVTARARFTEEGPLVRASSQTVTDAEGCFQLRLTRGAELYDVLFTPPAGDARPSVRLREQSLPDPAGEEALSLGTIQVPPMPVAGLVTVAVRGRDGNGNSVRIPGARVVLATEFAAPEGREDMEVVLEEAGETAAPSGNVTLMVPVNRTYKISVIPPADSTFSALFDHEATILGGSSVFLELERRLPLDGRLFTHDGAPISQAQVSAELSPEWSWTHAGLDALLQGSFLHPTVTTEETGDMLLWLNRTLLGRAAIYDLAVEPPLTSFAPRWSLDGIVAEQDDNMSLGDIRLPDGSWARGDVTTAAGALVPGAQVKLYQLRSAEYCDDQCTAPPYLRGTFTVDEEGRVRLVLPDPPPAAPAF